MFCVSQACVGCKSSPSVPSATPFDVEIHEMEFCSVLECSAEKHTQADMAMEKSKAEGEEESCKDQEAENDGTIMTSQINDQEMMIEEQGVTSQIEEETGASLSQMTH